MSLVEPVVGFFRTHAPLDSREFKSATEQLRAGYSLNPLEAHRAARALISDAIPDEAKADFLVALNHKGETAEEIASFALTFRELAVQPPVGPADVGGTLVDVCGSGGDKLHTFNISTATAFVVAAAGVPVAKHGNRAVTSRCGSADVLEGLGVQIELSPEAAADCLKQVGIAFFFAPLYHHAFKKIASVRKTLAAAGQTSIFNFLGPLLCPARPNAQLFGLPDPTRAACLAEALRLMGARRAIVATGQTESGLGMDELSTLGPSQVCELDFSGKIAISEIAPEQLGLPRARLQDLTGGDREDNAAIIRGILQARDKGPRRDIVLLNAAAAITVAGRSKDYAEGIQLARQVLESGAAAAKLEAMVSKTRS